VYPTALDQLDYIGDWDRIALAAVTYEQLPDGYALDLQKGWIGKPDVVYPSEFWKGLGLRRSNVKTAPPAS
jgi:hypothetical protein